LNREAVQQLSRRIDGGVTTAMRTGGLPEPAILAAAALHDIIEDTETTEEELGTSFGGTRSRRSSLT
jgi:hypothetical protein